MEVSTSGGRTFVSLLVTYSLLLFTMQHSSQVQAAEGVALDSQQTAKMGQKPALESALVTLSAGSSAAAVQFQLQKSVCGRPLLSSGGASKAKGSGNVYIADGGRDRQSGTELSNVDFPQEGGNDTIHSRSDGLNSRNADQSTLSSSQRPFNQLQRLVTPSHPVLGSSPDSMGSISPSYPQLLPAPPSFPAASGSASRGRETQSESQPVGEAGDVPLQGVPALSSRGFDAPSNSRGGTVMEPPIRKGIAKQLSGESPLAVSVCPRPSTSSSIQP